MEYKIRAQVECNKCYTEEVFWMAPMDVEDLMDQVSDSRWVVFSNRQYCPKCVGEYPELTKPHKESEK